MSLLQATELRKVYAVHSGRVVRAVDGVTLNVEHGAILAVTGPSGSGKTTLLALLCAMERPTSGRVAFDGIELTQCSGAELARVRRRLGFVFQDFGLIPHLTALENITYPLIPRAIRRAERTRRAESLLARFHLQTKASTRAGHLSGGEQQRVAIARALAGLPEALLADEPTSNLDTESINLLLDALREFHDAGGTVVIVSHDPRINDIATTRCTMTEGKLSVAVPLTDATSSADSRS